MPASVRDQRLGTPRECRSPEIPLENWGTRTRNSETPEDMRNIIFGEQERGLQVSGGSELRSGSVTPQAAVEEAGSPIGWISERDARVLSLEGS